LRSLPSLSPALRDTDPGIGWDQRTGTVSCLTSLYRVVARRVRSRPAGPVETGGSGRADAQPAGRRPTDPTPGSADARLLLGDAVDPTAAGVEFARIDSDDLPSRVHAFEHGGRLGVHRVVEGARDDPAVGDEMI